MSVAICSMTSGTVSFPLENKKQQVLGSIVMPSSTQEPVMVKNVDESPPPPAGELIDIWSSIQARKADQPNVVGEPYVHPLARPSSSSLMSQKSLEICTESLGSETGSSDDDTDYLMFSSTSRPIKQQAQQQEEEEEQEEVHDHDAGAKKKRKEEEEESAVNYHRSIGRGRTPSRAFPPPLPSISCRDGPCVQMRPHRKDGRLVVEAVQVPSQNYLQAQRQGGRLLLSFINTTTPTPKRNITDSTTTSLTPEQAQPEQVVDDGESMELEEDQEEEEEEEEVEEEEVEVVDRGTVVEVKVSTQHPQQQSGGGGSGRSAAMKVHRSSIVINKFVSCTSLSSQLEDDKENIVTNSSDDVDHRTMSTTSGPRRSTACSTTTAAAAAVAASSLGTLPADGSRPRFDNKLLFTTSKRRNREELLRDMTRCSQLRKPLFIWEPRCCIATSS